MSTYVYLECLDHDPPLLSYDEVGQHLSDLPNIRKAIANRDLFIANSAADLTGDYGDSFTNHAAAFLVRHPRCRIGIIDEYGRKHPISDPKKSAEQLARDLLEQCGIEDAQSFTAGDVIALANLIAETARYRHQLAAIKDRCVNFTPSPDVVDEILAILDPTRKDTDART